MDAPLLTNDAHQARWSSALRLAMAAGAAVAVTMTGITLLQSSTPSLTGIAQLYSVSTGEPNLGEADAQLAVHFDNFMSQYSKVYESEEERAIRFEIFKKNARFIKQANNKGLGYTLGENEFMDLTDQEFKLQYLGRNRSLSGLLNLGVNGEVDTELDVDKASLPESFDWRDHGCVTDVKKQGPCGSCWAFSATGALEGAYCAAGLGHVNLSAQQLVDCSHAEGNFGCQGGLMTQAFQYVLDNNGICSEADYPYTGTDDKCKSTTCKSAMTIDSFSAVPPKSEAALMAGIVKRGPISVGIEAHRFAFRFYKSGVFSEECRTDLNEGMLVVGYGSEDGQDYFIVKNSWGSDWGEKGYIRLARGGNKYNGDNGQCGILMEPVFPKVK